MKPKTISVISVLVVCGATCFLICRPTAMAQDVTPQSRSGEMDAASQTQAAENEVQTMAKVIEDAVNQTGLKGWQGSPEDLALFGPLVRTQYIPTVGVIFTIPVNFPITEVRLPELPAKSTDQDLWEKHSGTGLRQLKVDGFGIPSITADVVVYGQSASGKHAYDPETLRTFRGAIIETLAKYGHRMAHVEKSERILVVVEAPRFVGERMQYGGAGGIGARGHYGGLGGNDNGGVITWAVGGLGGAFGRDRLLIAINKADLTSPITSEQLEPKVQETRY